MQRWKTTIGTLLVTMAVWLVFTWPLPRHFMTAIPASAHHRWPAEIRPNQPGDHLQFMYYCWLVSDWLTGQTPAFNNLYEFNTGDDRAGVRVDSYYLPFSLIYSVGAWLGGRAFGWNLTGFLSLWLTYLCTYLLARRYTAHKVIPWLAALISITPTFRWINLAGGSPSGFAMAWAPVVLLGLDIAVRDGLLRGGWLAGLGILFAAWGDRHVFFFSVLAAPCWCVIAWFARAEQPWKSWDTWRSIFIALIPLAALTGLALAFPALMKASTRWLTGQEPALLTAGIRTMRDVMNFSPEWPGYWGLSPLGISDQIYLGYTVTAILSLGWLLVLARMLWSREKPAVREFLLISLIGLGIALCMILALGARSIWGAHLFMFARHHIPYYTLIRQPAKILSLTPTLLSVAAAITMTAWAALFNKRRWWLAVSTIVFVTLLVWECRRRVEPTVTYLDNQQGAYAAVAADAAHHGLKPHALIITLWPGDAHDSSMYQYYASLYRIRMVNGYNPFIKGNYFEEVFKPLFSVNQGFISDEQFTLLHKMGVQYVLFHENMFPEKVSPFPAAMTLKNLLNNPRLEVLQQDGPVWAFRILSTPQPHAEVAKNWTAFFPAREWELERCAHGPAAAIQAAEDASAHRFVTLAYTNADVYIPPVAVPAHPALRWLVRARGHGVLQRVLLLNNQPVATNSLTVNAPQWTWLTLPAPPFDGFQAISVDLAYMTGSVDLDYALLTAGTWPMLAPGQKIELPAALFFHSGMTDLKNSAALFRPHFDGAGVTFYGPKLPLSPGLYEIEVQLSSPAIKGTALGSFDLDLGADPLARTDIGAGLPAQLRVRVTQNLPVNLVFTYSGAAEIALQRVIFSRLE